MKRMTQVIFLTVFSMLYADGLDMEKLKGMQARSIGPAGMSGRVTAIDAVSYTHLTLPTILLV